MKKVILSLVVLITSSPFSTTVHAQLRNGTKTVSNDTISTFNLPAKHLLNPSFQTSTIAEFGFTDKSTSKNLIRFSNAAKSLLRMGTDLIRGGTEDVPKYSFENAWKYPGPTVKYPETASEYELFLKRYQRYTSEN